MKKILINFQYQINNINDLLLFINTNKLKIYKEIIKI